MSSQAKTQAKTPAAVKLGVVAPPHMHCGRTIPSVMKEICIALLPALIMAVYNFGTDALMVVGLSIATAVLTEAVCLKLMKKDLVVDDFHAVYIGLLLAFMLPASSPWWLPVIGAFVSISLGKMVFGGLGSNPFCPPAVGWAVLMLCWPELVDANTVQLSNELLDPLYRLKYFGVADAESSFTWQALLMGKQMGGLGATQVGALLAAGIILGARLDISIEVPVGFIGGVYAFAGLLHSYDPAAYAGPTFHLLAGCTVFGAFFLATEFGGSPSMPIARLAYGFIAGVLTILIRVFGIYTDGVVFAVLLANLVMPYLDMVKRRPFGVKK